MLHARHFTIFIVLSMLVLFFLSAPSLAWQRSSPLRFQPLRSHIGDTEEVALTVYFIGFPASLRYTLRHAVKEALRNTSIVDATPWWIPDIPKYSAQDFALTPAPPGLLPELVPPDGMLRYEPHSLTRATDPNTGLDIWIPNQDLTDLVDDVHRNLAIINNVDHSGALVDVPWKADPIRVRFLPADVLEELRQRLVGSRVDFDSTNPPASFALYSYNVLFDWLETTPLIREQPGGASLVFVNLEPFAGQSYSFYAEPSKDLIPAIGNGPVEQQYAPVVATNPENQVVADLLSQVLGGGLTQAKMFAALEVTCANAVTAGQAGITIPGMRPTQPICAEWSLDPIRNLLGNKGRRLFVSDTTLPLAQYKAGTLSATSFVQQIRDDLFELYRYGVLQQTIKANHVYSEAYELRTLLVDLRYEPIELCILGKLREDVPPEQAVLECASEQRFFPTEKTYDVSDVFDPELATHSLSRFNPGHWMVNFVPFQFGVQPDGSVNTVDSAQTKAFLREFLNAPVIPNPATGAPVAIPHFPLYRKMNILDRNGAAVEITSHWEKGLDFLITQLLFVEDLENNGLGIYERIWPDAPVTHERPFHETGKPAVKPLVLVLTPAPDGPLGEKWGTFPINNLFNSGLGLLTDFGSSSFWLSVGGNEEAGGLLRRDFSMLVPQYFLGPQRGAGSDAPLGVMPDGSVSPFPIPGLSKRRLELGAPHWCNEFDSPDETKRHACRDFVRTTTTLQSIETLQHGLGYVHSPEPRERFHYDGQLASIAKTQQLLADPSDTIGIVLNQSVNQYTTLGVSTVWGQITSEWNGVGPHAGMQASLHRSHVREETFAAEGHLRYAIEKFKRDFNRVQSGRDIAFRRRRNIIFALLRQAVEQHRRILQLYDAWDYEKALLAATTVLSFTDQALTMMGEPDRLHDPLAAPQAGTVQQENVQAKRGIPKALMEQVVKGAAEALYTKEQEKPRSPFSS